MIFLFGHNLPHEIDSRGYFFLFRDDKLLLKTAENGFHCIPLLENGLLPDWKITHRVFLGLADGIPCHTAVLDKDGEIPEGYSFQGIRQIYDRIEEEWFHLAGRASHILHWSRNNLYCSRCGKPMENSTKERAKKCTGCGLTVYQRISPAIIVAVIKEGKILLARAKRYGATFYSVLAGFVEPGESLEDCVHREIKEEVGIEVKNIRYFGSQPWPFPDSLMIGFTAEHCSGEITIDDKEIVEAGWFKVDNLPNIPGKISIARQLIDWYCEKYKTR